MIIKTPGYRETRSSCHDLCTHPTEKEIVIDSIITIHYFEYMRDFVFRGESHDFWEFLYVDRGTVLVTAGESDFQLTTGNIIFHKPKEFHAIRSIEKILQTL